MTGLLLLALPSARAFSLAGPQGADTWQTTELGYGPLNYDPVYPKDFMEGYRIVTPVLYYAADSTFLDYYGMGALTNVDAAFAIINGALCGHTNSPIFLQNATSGYFVNSSGITNGGAVTLASNDTVDKYSSDLSEFPQKSAEVNYTARAARIVDLKSHVLRELVLDIGLEDPMQYVWTLHNRVPDPFVKTPQCPQDWQYLVVQRNFDLNALSNAPYSAYINNSLFTYEIYDYCGPTTDNPWTAITHNTTADGSASRDTSLATGGILGGELASGHYFTGVTRDDLAGLRFLMSTNSVHWESTAVGGAQLVTTNLVGPQKITTMNLGALIAASGTNNPAQLQAMFPGLSVVGLATNYSIGWVTNYTAYYTNKPGDPWGTPPQLIYIPNATQTLVTTYVNAFANIVTNHYYPTSLQSTLTVTVGNHPGWPDGSPLDTNVSYSAPSLVNVPSGDFYVIPAGSVGYNNIFVITNAVVYTNVLVSVNSTGTNAGTTLTTPGYSFAQSTITYGTNYTLWVYALTVAKSTPAVALRQGIGRVQFIRADYDSLLGQTFQHFTNSWSIVKIEGGQRITENYTRETTAPDFVFSAKDLTVPAPPRFPYGPDSTVPIPQFDQTGVRGGLSGPGTITPGGMNFTFNKSVNGSLYRNGSMNYYNEFHGGNYNTNALGKETPIWLDEDSQISMAAWGSFDQSTNMPVLYASSSSIVSLLNQVIIQVAPASLADGTNGVPYSVTFTHANGQSPYDVWSTPNSFSGVPGLSFNPATQILSGTPTMAGTFTFILLLTDSGNRTVTRNYPITIH